MKKTQKIAFLLLLPVFMGPCSLWQPVTHASGDPREGAYALASDAISPGYDSDIAFRYALDHRAFGAGGGFQKWGSYLFNPADRTSLLESAKRRYIRNGEWLRFAQAQGDQDTINWVSLQMRQMGKLPRDGYRG